jgi:hypothetical protein
MQTTLADPIADLIAALHRDDADRIARALIRLEAHLGPDEIADLLAGLWPEEPPAFRRARPTPGPVGCA